MMVVMFVYVKIMDENVVKTEYEIINRDNYYRIFKDEEEIESLKKTKIKEINFIRSSV